MPRLLTLDEHDALPASRIGGPDDAYNYVYDLIQADNERAKYRTHIQGLVDGNAPHPKSKRDRTNLNFRQGSAIITQFRTPYYDLLCEVPLLFEVATTFGNSEERADWSQIISEEYHRMVTSWEDWDVTMQQCINQMLVHNIGHLYWENRYDWRPQPALMNEILVADQSPCRLSRLEAVVIRKGYLSTELMNFIDNEKEAKDVGWNPKAVKSAVKQAYHGEPADDRATNWEWFQQKRKNADLYFGAYECERIWTAHCAVREYDKVISDHLLRTDRQTGSFLFHNRNAFDSMDEMIRPFFYDIGDGTWHSGSGLGKDIFPYCQVFNKLRCREVDAALISASVLVQAKDSTAARHAQMLTLDNLKILPEGVNFLEHQIGQNIQATVDVRRDMEAALNSNIGSLTKAPNQANPRKSSKQALAEMYQAAQLSKGKINLFYGDLDSVARTMFAKATRPGISVRDPGGREALDMIARCEKRGVPRQALSEIDFVRAQRSFGAGSAANTMMALEMLKDVAPSFYEPGKVEYLRAFVSRLLGQRAADLFVGEVKTSDRHTGEESIAALENNALRQGGKVVVAADNNHVIHLTSHNGDAEEHLQELEQIAQQRELEVEDLQPVFVHLDAYGPHAFQHLEKLKDDPIRKSDYAKLNKQWQAIAKMHDQVKHNLVQMQEERQRQQQEQATQQPQINPELLKNLQYDKVPESVKAQIESASGAPRQPGELSVSKENILLKEENARLKREKEQLMKAKTDVQLSMEAQRHAKEMSQPAA